MDKIDIKAIVARLKKDYWDWQLSKADPIPKPKLYHLPLRRNQCTLVQLRKKYPEPWSVGQVRLLKLAFGHGFGHRTYGSQSSRPSRKSRSR